MFEVLNFFALLANVFADGGQFFVNFGNAFLSFFQNILNIMPW